MTVSKQIQAQIQKYAKVCTKLPLTADEPTYFERMGERANVEINRHHHQIGGLRIAPQAHLEEAEELAGYMTDYVQDCVEKKQMTEQAALEQAKKVFTRHSPDNPLVVDERYNQWQAYYREIDNQTKQAIWLLYLSRMLFGLVIGGILGSFGEIWYEDQVVGMIFWIMLLLGLILGFAMGLATNAWIALRSNSTNKKR
ncbi:hypothetical protein BSQ39_00905 [Loigolactobacillus backii]|uniref:hypothetical protein n=1 Tax=Loigolactobacillus backii TaxID=375175 RepID=UPI000C1CB98E|nr:hypothetical protein [Loigolactobacillus backii]PIO82218.1 hypothetical protein BSQ39_00905 [Loigolactobacillus backii]